MPVSTNNIWMTKPEEEILTLRFIFALQEKAYRVFPIFRIVRTQFT